MEKRGHVQLLLLSSSITEKERESEREREDQMRVRAERMVQLAQLVDRVAARLQLPI